MMVDDEFAAVNSKFSTSFGTSIDLCSKRLVNSPEASSSA